MANESSHFDHFTYDNGLQLVTVSMKDRKVATVLVIVGTGSRYETKKINGVSHFLEHMMFKGTTKRPGALDISMQLDSIGADSNAFTSKEYTGYYARAAAEHTDLMLDIIADIFQNSVLDAKEIEKEKGVIIEEINMYLDTPRRHVGDMFESLLYGDHPLGWNIAGEKEIIMSLDRASIADYFTTHYFAENTIIAVSGNIDSNQIHDAIPKYFDVVRHGTSTTYKDIDDTQQTAVGLKIMQKSTDQTNLILGVRAYHMTDPKIYAAELLSIILGGNMSSRLFIELREKRGLAYSVSTSASSFTDVGYLATQIGVDNRRAPEAIKVVLEEYMRIAKDGVPEEELLKAKDFNKGKTYMALDSPDFIASYIAEQQLLKKNVLTPEQELERFQAVTADDIGVVAKEIFQKQKLNLALIGPFTQDDKDINSLLNVW